MEGNLAVVNLDTGQILNELEPGDKILRAKSVEFLNNRKKINTDKGFVKLYPDMLYAVAERLDSSSVRLLSMLTKYISYNDGILEYSNGKPLSRESIIMLSPFSDNTTERCLDMLVENEIIGKHKTGRRMCYTINPFIFMKGVDISTTLYKMFEKSRWAKM